MPFDFELEVGNFAEHVVVEQALDEVAVQILLESLLVHQKELDHARVSLVQCQVVRRPQLSIEAVVDEVFSALSEYIYSIFNAALTLITHLGKCDSLIQQLSYLLM